jgi:hypothetical protein
MSKDKFLQVFSVVASVTVLVAILIIVVGMIILGTGLVYGYHDQAGKYDYISAQQECMSFIDNWKTNETIPELEAYYFPCVEYLSGISWDENIE